jgi:hypothetical protein
VNTHKTRTEVSFSGFQNTLSPMPTTSNMSTETGECSCKKRKRGIERCICSQCYACPMNNVTIGVDVKAVGGVSLCRTKAGSAARKALLKSLFSSRLITTDSTFVFLLKTHQKHHRMSRHHFSPKQMTVVRGKHTI